jgi:hypothetical protein
VPFEIFGKSFAEKVSMNERQRMAKREGRVRESSLIKGESFDGMKLWLETFAFQ